eukprot:12862805-Alexandrium_andersonii.AAC.1
MQCLGGAPGARQYDGMIALHARCLMHQQSLIVARLLKELWLLPKTASAVSGVASRHSWGHGWTWGAALQVQWFCRAE